MQDEPARSAPAPAAPGADTTARAADETAREFDRPLGELARRPPVCCGAHTPLGEALQAMRRERVGAIVVVDDARRPLGIFTLGDLLARVALPQAPLATPMGQLMSARLLTLPAQAPAFEAALLMARENIRHVPVMDGSEVVGVVSESRLFALWRRGIGALRAALGQAGDVDAVVQAAHGIHELPAQLLRAGLTASAVTALITALNDLIVERLLALTGLAKALQPMQGCWLALGSQGRAEQTLATDQDNAILFDDGGDAEVRRRELLPLARTVNEALDRCGFPLCRGDIMASNPQWCLAHAEWQRRFADWIDRPDARALLNATIFFDFRPIAGQHALAAALRNWLTGYARGKDRFLMLMVLNAQGNQPPLGLMRDFVLQHGGEHPQTLDLKTNGVQPFVEGARIYALASGIEATHTVARIEGAARARDIPTQDSAAWCDAFRAIQRMRLRLNTEQQAAGLAMHNYLDPETLNVLDRNVLKEALRQARSLQNRLARDFSLGATNVRT